MKIGILTFHRGPNYGGFLQAWHMREAIRSLGHDATIINYQAPAHHAAEQPRLSNLTIRGFKGYVINSLKARPFGNLVDKLCDNEFQTNANLIDWERFKAVVVGADIVWNFTNRLYGNDPVFYGAHPGQSEVRLIAYAPSCGEADLDCDLPPHVNNGLNKFSHIMVRDTNTATLVERATQTRPPLVIDPTWLQNDPHTPRSHARHQPYALVYGSGLDAARATVLRSFTRKKGLKLISAASPCKGADKFYLSPNPWQWVDLHRNAQCVITSTFHGLLYAIKYRKPLIFMERFASKGKSLDVIERCRIQDRVISENSPFTEQRLEFCLTQSNGCFIPEDWKHESLRALNNALADIHNS